MEKLRNIVRKFLSEAYMIPPKAQGMKSVSYADMTLVELRNELAKAEEQMITANPQLHSDSMWSKWMRERITNINNAIKEKSGKKEDELGEHYVDSSWSRDGLEPSLQDTLLPLTFEKPNMMMPGGQASGSHSFISEAEEFRTIVFEKEINPAVKITIKIGRDGRIAEIENERGIRFPYVKGQPFNRGLETWASVNGFLMDGKNVGPEKKVFGVKVSDYPAGHPVRLMYPGKFRT